LTSGSRLQAFWVVMLPFALMNLAGWAQPNNPRADPEHGARDWTGRFSESVVLVLGVSLTVLLMVGVSFMSMDEIGYQCGSSPSCSDRFFWLTPVHKLPALPAQRMAVGVVVPLAVLSALVALGWLTRRRYERVRPPSGLVDEPAQLLARRSTWTRASAIGEAVLLHAGAGLAGVASMLAWGARDVALLGRHSARMDTATALIGISVIVLAAVASILHSRAAQRHADASGNSLADSDVRGLTVLAWVVLAVGAVVLVASVALAAASPSVPDVVPHAGPLPGLGRAAELVFVVQLALLLALALVSLAAPRAGGKRWHAPVILAILGVATAGSALAGLAIVLARMLGRAEPGPRSTSPLGAIVFPASFDWVAVAWVGALVLLVAGAVATYAFLWVKRRRQLVAEINEEYRCELARWAGGHKAARWECRVKLERLLAAAIGKMWAPVSGVAATFLGASIVVLGVHLAREGLRPLSPLPGPVGTAAPWVVAFLPALGALALILGWNSEIVRRRVGNIWDIASFWPRWFHPLAPPCYAERAIPELQVRIAVLAREGGVIVSAHSQGCILAVTALEGLAGGESDARKALTKVELMTYGCPLAKLFRVGFPRYFEQRRWDWLGERLADVAGECHGRNLPTPHGWVNFFRLTDPIGPSPIFSEARGGGDGTRTGRAFSEVPAAHATNAGDVLLADPQHVHRCGDAVLGPPLGHSHYLADATLLAYTKWLARLLLDAQGAEQSDG
jgi:hypothetical protein